MHREFEEAAQAGERSGASQTLVSTNPATGELVWSGTSGDAAAEVALARAAWPGWAAHSNSYRMESLRRFANVVRAREGEFAELIDGWIDPDLVRFSCGEQAHQEWLEWSEPKPREVVKLDLGPCVAAMRERLPESSIICNGAGNFSGWWHRYWRYGPMPTQLAPTSGTMGYGVPAAVAAALRFKDRPVVALAGDGDFLMNGQELATAAQYGVDLLVILVDNSCYGTIRMHQEREYPKRVSATELRNPDFAVLAKAYGGWAETVETTADFAPALDKAMKRKGIRLLHCKTDVEQISNATTITKLREKAKK